MKKVRASTLVETLVAAAILSIVAGLGIMIFLRLSTPSSNGAALLEAQQTTYALSIPSPFSPELPENREVAKGPLFYESSWAHRGEALNEQTLTVTDASGNIVYTRKRLYYAR